jgi:hypothetical protein
VQKSKKKKKKIQLHVWAVTDFNDNGSFDIHTSVSEVV